MSAKSEPGGAARTVTVLSVLSAAFASAVGRALSCGDESALELAWVALLALPAIGALALAHRLRGRWVWADGAHPILWLVPWQLMPLSVIVIAATACASAVLLGVSCGWRSVWSWLRLAPSRIHARLDQRTIGLLVMIGLMWLSHLSLPTKTDPPGLDSSWQEVKGYELVHHWRTGVDTVFTYGPLGYFHPAPFNRDLFWWKTIWWEIVFKLVLTSFVVLSARRMGGPLEKTLFFLALLSAYSGQDSFFFVAVVAISMRLLAEPHCSGPTTALGFLCFALLALVKFTSFVLITICVGFITVQRAFVVSWRSGVRTLALYGVILVTLWTVLGQSPLDLPRYVLTSWWIAQGYNEGMTWIGSARDVVLAYWIVGLTGAVAVLHVLQRPRALTAWVRAGVLCIGTFMALKAGFVRHNPIIFTGFAGVASFLLPALEARRDRERILRGIQTLARVACAILGLYASALTMNFNAFAPAAGFFAVRCAGEAQRHAESLAMLPELKGRMDHDRQAIARAYSLPKIRAAVGDEPVDVFGSNQALALFNDLNYRPRPVFQSYSAYTPELMELNARFYSGERAPRFVLFDQESLDDRLPGGEDGLALQVLMRDYDPVLSEGGMLLLERVAERRTSSAKPRVLLEKTIDFDETVDLDRIYAADPLAEPADAGAPRGCLVLTLDLHMSLWGRLRTTLFKGPRVFINSKLSTGEVGTYRLVPGLMRTGVVVSPFLNTRDAWIKWFCGQPVSRISSFRVSLHPQSKGLLEPRIGLRIVRDDRLLPRVDPALVDELTYSMFSTAPEYVHCSPPAARSRIENFEALLMQAPGEMSFKVAAGKHSIVARFGLIKEAFAHDCSDGAGFSVVARDEQGLETVLYYLLLDRKNGSRRAPHALAVEFDTSTPARILFKLDPGPSGQVGCDWGYWTGVSIADVAPAPRKK